MNKSQYVARCLLLSGDQLALVDNLRSVDSVVEFAKDETDTLITHDEACAILEACMQGISHEIGSEVTIDIVLSLLK